MFWILESTALRIVTASLMKRCQMLIDARKNVAGFWKFVMKYQSDNIMTSKSGIFAAHFL